MSSRPLAGVLCLLAVLSLVPDGAVRAQKPQRPFGTVVAEWNRTLDRAAQELANPDLSAARAKTLKENLSAVEAEARAIKQNAQSAVDPLRVQLEALGPPPAEGEQPELAEIAEQRRKIEEDVASYQARIKQADLAITRAKELGEQIAARTLERSIELLFRSYPLPVAPGTIATAVPDSVKILTLLARSPLDWWWSLTPDQRERVVLYRIAVIVILAFAIGWGLRRALLRWFGRDPAIQRPTYARRLSGAIGEGVAYGIVPALILAGFLFRALSDASIVSGLFAHVIATFCGVMIMFTLAWALPRAVLAPELPAWRLVPIAPHNARAISRRVTYLAGVFAIDLFLVVSSRGLVISDELISLYTLLTNTLEAAGILALIQGDLWAWEDEEPGAAEEEAGARRGGWNIWTTLRRATGLVAVAVVLTALAGYANLSRYLTESLVISGMAVGILFLLRGLGRELIGVALRSTLLQVRLAVPHKTRTRYKFWLRAVLDLVINVGGVILVLVIWGVPPRDILAWSAGVLKGFKIGSVTISLTDIFIAILVFLAAMAVTRAAQRLLTERVFPQTDLDPGVRHSLSAGLGYLGLALAAVLAVSAVGLDLSNIALIAGALSVGIGFGLQNVVNNFVSGLILLIERPIKVGDWIVVGAHEGTVKRINVRATEIETFQRASVIVPNSELIAGAVTNWTHKDRYGRIEVPVGVAYGSDVERVMAILNECLKANKGILAWPEPYVLFRGFGESSLDFEARGYLGNIELRNLVISDLCVAIERALREAGIEIPFPQRDLHIKTVDGLDQAVRRREELAAGAAASAASGSATHRAQARRTRGKP
ncbi:MAG: mechanosensitive ion channel domain-containing protein [Kiloniellaceae bacterium]